MTRGRRLLAAGSIAVTLLVAAVAASAFLIPGERVAAAVASRAEAILGERVRLEGVGLRFLPLPGVRLTGVSVGGSTDSTALATARSVELRARLLPLLRGDVVISSLEIESPRVLLEIDASGRPNLPLLQGGADTVPEPRGGRDISFAIDRVRIRDGRIGYRDLRDGAVLRFDGWQQQLRLAGEVRDGGLGRIELAGWVEFDDIDTRLPGVVVPVRDLSLRVTHDAALDRGIDRIDLREISVLVSGTALTGAGSIDAVSSATARSATLRLAADQIDARQLVALLPDSLRARLALRDGRRLEPSGLASVQLDVNGPLTTDSLPAFDGALSVEDGTLALEGEALLADVRAEGVFAADSALARLTGNALGEPFTAVFAVRNPAAPTLDLAFSGRGDLGRLRALGLVSDTLTLAGSVRADIRGSIPTRDPAAARARGTVELTSIRITGMDPTLEVPSAMLTLEGQRLRVDRLRVAPGRQAEIEVALVAEGWIPALLDSLAAPPALRGQVTIDSLDLDRLLGPPEGQYPALLFARLGDRPLDDGRSAGDAAEAMGLALPKLPRLDAELRITARSIRRSGLAYSNLDALLRLSPTALELAPIRFDLMGGTIQATARLEPTAFDSAGNPLAARVLAEYGLENVGAAPFFDRLTPFRDHLTGTLGLAGSVAMGLDRHALPDRSSVGAQGGLALSQGRLSNWRVLEASAARLGITAFDTIAFRDWGGTFRITGPLVTLDDTALEAEALSARAAGSFDFGGKLDLGTTLYLSRALAQRAGAVGEQILAAAGSDGTLPVGLQLTGTAAAPQVTLDLSEARSAVVARAREAANEQARQVAARASDQVMDRLELPDSLRGLAPDSLRSVMGDSLFGLLPDSLKLPDDSIGTRVEDEVRNRLRKLLGGNR